MTICPTREMQCSAVKREIFAAFLVRVFRIRTGLRGYNFAIAEWHSC